MKSIRKYFLFSSIILIIITLIGCNSSTNKKVHETRNNIPNNENVLKNNILTLNSVNEKWLYNPYVYEMGIYNTETYKFTPCFSDTKALQYCFQLGSDYPYVVTGNSETWNFEVYDYRSGKMKKITSLTDAYLTPFATDGSNFYYILGKKTNEGIKKSIITIMDKGIDTVLDIGDAGIEYGVISNGILYYSVYIKDSDDYKIYQFNLTTKKAPEVIANNIKRGELFVNNNELLFSTNGKIYNKSRQIPYKGVFIKIIDKMNIMAQWDADKDGGMVLKFIDILTDKEIDRVPGGINYEIEDDIITVFGDKGIKKIKCDKYINGK